MIFSHQTRMLRCSALIALIVSDNICLGGKITFRPLLGESSTVATRVNDISDNGAVVVGDVGSDAGSWNLVDETHQILTTGGSAVGVSADGQMVVGNSATTEGAFRWTAGGAIVSFPRLPGAARAYATAVSGDGNVTLGNSPRTGFPSYEAISWIGTAEPRAFSDGSQFDDPTTASATSYDGKVSVGSVGEAIAIWEGGQGAGPIKLNPLPNSLGHSAAEDVTPDGKMVVGWSGRRAFSWSHETQLVDLGMMRGMDVTAAKGVSAEGSIVVGFAQAFGPELLTEAVILGPSGNWRTIEELLATSGHATEWQLLSAEAISADGRTVVGNGISPRGLALGWAITIPEPSTRGMLFVALALLAIAGSGLARSRPDGRRQARSPKPRSNGDSRLRAYLAAILVPGYQDRTGAGASNRLEQRPAVGRSMPGTE